MPPFHRKTANPAGYDAFPSGYDYINDPPANGDPGAAAPVSTGKKVGGPNDGTYLYAFGEDVLSQNLNRSSDALAENCDTLDEFARKPVPRLIRSTLQTAVGAVATINLATITGVTSGVWLADGTDATEDLNDLFVVVNQNDEDIYDATPSKCVVTGFTSTDGGDVLGVGFSAGSITLNISPSIPNGTQYRVYFHTKSNNAEGPTNISAKKRAKGVARHNRHILNTHPTFTTPVTVSSPAHIGHVNLVGSSWTQSTSRFEQRANAPGVGVAFWLNLPVGASLTSFVVRFRKETGLVSLPPTLPEITFGYATLVGSGDTLSTLVNTIIAPANLAAYEAYTPYTFSLGGHVVSEYNTYYIQIIGDNDSTVVPLYIYRPSIVMDLPQLKYM